MEDMVFDQETFEQTERRLDQINGLKAKYGQSIGKILEYQKLQMEKLEKIQQYDQLYQEAKEKLCQCEKVLQKNGDELSKIRKEYSRQLEAKVIQGLQDLNFANVDFAISFKQPEAVQLQDMMLLNMKYLPIREKAGNHLARSYPVVNCQGSCLH